MKTKIFLLGLLLITRITAAQTGNIKGKIIDSKTKQPIVGANVLVLDENYGAASDEQGYFFIKNVPENIYKLSVKYIGYKEHIEPDVRVIRNKTFYSREMELVQNMLIGDEIVVTSGNFDEDFDVPVSNHSFTKEEIVRAPGAGSDVLRAIDNLPGVTSGGGEFSEFSVRGSGPKDNIILVDNIPFGRLSHFNEVSGSQEIEGGRLSIFSTGLIQKATFQGGGFSVKNGGKFASLLDLTIKEGNRESIKLDGSYDLFGWEVNYDGKTCLLDNSGLRFSARSWDFKRTLELVDEVGAGYSKISDYVAKFTTDINPSNKLSLLGIYSTEGWIRDVDNIYDGEDFDNRELRDDKEDRYLAGINWRFLTNQNSYLTTSAYFNKTKTVDIKGRAYSQKVNGARPVEENVSLRNPLRDYALEESRLGIKSDYSYSWDKNLSFGAGINVQNTNFSTGITQYGIDTLYTFNENEIPTGGDKFLIVDPDEITNYFKKNRAEYAGYSEISFPLSERFKMNTGLRYEYNDLAKQSTLSPRMSATYQLCPMGSLNFAAGIYYQIPEMMLLAGHRSNARIKNEKAYHYVLGITRYFGDDIKSTAEIYYKKMEDLVVRPNSNSNIAQNSGEGYAYGFDFSLIKRFVAKLYGQLNYSYGVSKIKDEPGLAYYNSTFNQPHVFNIMAGYQLNDNWSFTAKWKYATGRPKDNYIIYEDVHNDPENLRYSKSTISKNTERFDTFHTLNARIDYRVQFYDYLAFTAFLDLMDLYGRKNAFYEIFYETTGKLKAEGSTFFPRFGFKFEF